MNKIFFCLAISSFLICGCAGLKVVDPNKPDNKGMLQVDYSGGSPKLVETYTCNILASGKRLYATGKSEEEARKEAIAKCQDQSIISSCKTAKIACEKN